MTRPWRWSFLLHAAVWVALAVLSWHVKIVAHLPIIAIFAMSAVPYVLLHTVGIREGSPAFGILYTSLSIGTVIAWILVTAKRHQSGKSGMALISLHILIALCGMIAVMMVGSINFPFVL